MSKINPKKAFASEIFDGFGGIGSKQTFGKAGLLSMRNFRILPDDSIQKRCGWSAECTFNDPIRGYWHGELGGHTLCFVATGHTIYRIDATQQIDAGDLSAEEGRVRFFTYGGYLYVLDGADIQCFNPQTYRFVSASGYVPLVGRNWNPTSFGVVNEPLNLLNKRMRIHYRNTSGATEFSLPLFVSSIDRVRLDTQLTNDFTLKPTKDAFTIGRPAESVEICCTIMIETDENIRLREVTRALSHRSEVGEQLLLYGAAGSNLLFSAVAVDENMIGASRSNYPDSDPLYVTSNSMIPLGDAEHPITSVCPHRERYLAFHKDGAYSVSVANGGGTVEAYPLLRGMGCRAIDAIVHLDGDPVVINSSGVFVLRAPASDDDAFRIECLSEQIPALSDDSFADLAITAEDPVHGELWFATPQSDVYVYHTARRQWYTFSGIKPEFFLRKDDRMGFAVARTVALFDEELTTDNGSRIVANLQTGYLAFGYPELHKRSLRLSICADPGSRATVDVSSEQASVRFTLDAPSNAQTPVVLDRRIAFGRFRLLRVTLNDTLGTKSRYYRLALFANV